MIALAFLMRARSFRAGRRASGRRQSAEGRARGADALGGGPRQRNPRPAAAARSDTRGPGLGAARRPVSRPGSAASRSPAPPGPRPFAAARVDHDPRRDPASPPAACARVTASARTAAAVTIARPAVDEPHHRRCSLTGFSHHGTRFSAIRRQTAGRPSAASCCRNEGQPPSRPRRPARPTAQSPRRSRPCPRDARAPGRGAGVAARAAGSSNRRQASQSSRPKITKASPR